MSARVLAALLGGGTVVTLTVIGIYVFNFSAGSDGVEVLREACSRMSEVKVYEIGRQQRSHMVTDELPAGLTSAPARTISHLPVVSETNIYTKARVFGNDYHRIRHVLSSPDLDVAGAYSEVIRIAETLYINSDNSWESVPDAGGSGDIIFNTRTDLGSRLCPSWVQSGLISGEVEVESVTRSLKPATRVMSLFVEEETVDTVLVESIRGGTYGITPDQVNAVEQSKVHSVDFWIDSLGHIIERRHTTYIFQDGKFRGVVLDEVITLNVLESLSLELPN